MADEGGMHNLRAEKDDDNWFYRKWFLIIKVAEVILALIAVGLVVDPFDSFLQIFYHQPKLRLFDVAITYVTLVGFVIINIVTIISMLLGSRIPKMTALLYTIIGLILHVFVFILMFYNWRKLNGSYAYVYNNHTFGSKLYMDMLISSTIITLINSVVYAWDVYFTYRRY